MFINLINLINLNLKHNKKKFKIKLNKNDFQLIKIFIKINLIKNIRKKEKNIYIVYISPINNIFKNIINLYKPSQIIFLNFKNLKKISFFYNGIIILSTNRGLITNFEAIKKKIGGFIILKLWN